MKRAKALLISITIILLLFIGFTSPTRAGEIRIGAVTDLTGPTAPGVGLDYGWGIIDFWRYVNEEKGGILGHKVKVLLSDTQYKAAQGLAAIKKFAEHDKVVAIHLYGTGTAAIYKPTIMKIKIPGICAQSTNCSNEYIFLDQAPYTVECWAAMDYMKKDHKGPGKPKIALFTLGNNFGRSVIKGAKWYANKIGIDLAVIEDLSFGVLDSKPILLRLKSKGIQYIYHNNVTKPVATMLKDARAIGYKVKQFAMSYSGESVLFDLTGEAADGFIVSTSLNSFHEKTMEFPRELVKRYRPGKGFPSQVYGCGIVRGMVFEEAIKRAIQQDGLDKLTGQKVKEAMEKLKNFHVHGIVPAITYGPNRRVPSFSKRLLQANWAKRQFDSVTDFEVPMGIKGMDENEIERLLEDFERYTK